MKLGLPIQWRVGGILLIVGGALSLVGSAIFNFGPLAVGSIMTIAGVFFEGAGIVTVSFAFDAEKVATWARRLLFASGIIVLVEFVVTLLEALAVGIPNGISAVLYVGLGAALLIAAIDIFRTVPAGRAVRWALLPAAIYQAADLLLLIAGYGGQWWTLAGLGALYLLAGVVFLRYRIHSTVS